MVSFFIALHRGLANSAVNGPRWGPLWCGNWKLCQGFHAKQLLTSRRLRCLHRDDTEAFGKNALLSGCPQTREPRVSSSLNRGKFMMNERNKLWKVDFMEDCSCRNRFCIVWLKDNVNWRFSMEFYRWCVTGEIENEWLKDSPGQGSTLLRPEAHTSCLGRGRSFSYAISNCTKNFN